MKHLHGDEVIGRKVGLDMAMIAVIGGSWHHWQGLGEIGQQMLTKAGLEYGSDSWAIAERAAKESFEDYFLGRASRRN